jgi:hypothetical protein
MKAKITYRISFAKLLNYILRLDQKGQGAEMIGGTATGSDPAQLAAAYRVVAAQRSTIGKPAWHCSLSLPVGERLDDETWNNVVRDFLSKMLTEDGINVDDTMYTVVRHSDTDNDHIHIMLNRVSNTGKVFKGKFDVTKAIRFTSELEREYNLTLTPKYNPEVVPAAKRETDPVRRKREAAGIKDMSKPMQFIVDEVNALYKRALKNTTCKYTNFCRTLEQRGIHIVPKVQIVDGTPAITGLHYQCLDTNGALYSLKASALGSKHTWRKLQQMGITFDPMDEATAQLVLNQTTDGAGTRALADKPDVGTVVKLIKQKHINDAIAAADAQMAARKSQVAPIAPITSEAPVIEVTPQIEVPTKPVAPPKIKRRM